MGRLFLFWWHPIGEQDAKEFYKQKNTHDVTTHSYKIFNLHTVDRLWDVYLSQNFHGMESLPLYQSI